ncbi:MAG: patatin-like phospholipase family protein [Acetobacteraceae bacterium]|nr:patatin-like phospholipase family protein [Acetobacteraceae bacterium]
MRRLGLALSGGSVRGVAHVGVLKALRDAGIEWHCVAGTSSGAIVAALAAAGVGPDRLEELASGLRWHHLSDIAFSRWGPVDNRKLRALLDQLLEGREFKDLPRPLAVVATDLLTGREVVIREGSVAHAVQGSCAVPGVFRPVRWRDKLLVDGGITTNLPTRPCRAMGADVVLAVDLTPQPGPVPEPRNVIQILLRALDIMQRANVARDAEEADILLQPRVGHFGHLDLSRWAQIAAEGERAAREALPAIRAALGLSPAEASIAAGAARQAGAGPESAANTAQAQVQAAAGGPASSAAAWPPRRGPS